MDTQLKKQIVNCYMEYLGDNLVAIALFGSRARGDSHPDSDYDLFIVARQLPEGPLQRMRFIRRPLTGRFEPRISIIARTPGEIEAHFPPLFLDLGLDAKILYDTGFLGSKLARIRDIIKEAGLERKVKGGELWWEWKKQPKGNWRIDWSGYHDG